MATGSPDIPPVCDVRVLTTKRVLLVENVVFQNVMPCIAPILTSSNILSINEQNTETDKIRKIIDVIDRLAHGSQFRAFNAFINALAGTQPKLFKRIVGRAPTVAETNFCIKNITQQMKENIKGMGHRTDSELDEKIDFSYEHVDLSIVDRQSDIEPEHEVPHQYRDHLTRLEGTDRNISACDILSNKSKPNEKVLVFGRPGVGKSTTTQWLARQWALGKWATGVTMLFLLQVRFLLNVDVQITALDLLTLFSLYQLEDMADSLALSSWLKNPASRILIFADGLDEIPGFASRMINTRRISDLTHRAHPIDLIVNILRGDLLPHSRVISASRPFLGLCKLHVDSKAEILGLTSKKVAQYVERRYPDKADHIWSVLERNPILSSVCGITFYCMLISRLLSEGVVLIDEEVQTYTRLMAFILIQYTSRRVSGSTFCLATNSYLSKLANLAFSGIFHSQDTKLTKLYFDEKDLLRFKINEDVLQCTKKTGIIQVTERKIGRKSLVAAEFFHLTGQEMLAALYFLSNSTCPDEILNSLFAGGHFDMTLMYTFGLNFDKTSTWVDELWTAMDSSGHGADTSIKSQLPGTNALTILLAPSCVARVVITSQLSKFIDWLLTQSENKLKVCQLIHEAQWVEKAREVFSHIAPNGELSMKDVTMTAIDLLAVDFVCRCGGCLTSITLQAVNADATFVKVMMSSLVKHNLGTHLVSDQRNNAISPDGARIGEDVSGIARVNTGTGTEAGTEADMVQTNSGLHTLNISRNSIGAAGAEAIAAMLETNTSLHTLNMSSTYIGDSGAVAMFKTNSSLHTLDISDSSIGAAGAEAIAAMLHTNTSLHTLHIAGNSIGAVGAEAISAMLETNISLHTLNMSSSYIGGSGAVAMAAMLKTNNSLHTLYIGYNTIGDAGAEAMAAMLNTNNSLHTLEISHNNIGAAGAEAIAAMLQTNISLHTLDISENSIGAAGAEAIAAMLQTNISLHTLHISENSIGAAGAEAVAAMLQTNISLHTLDISVNSIGDAGAEAIAAMLETNTGLHTLLIAVNSIGAAGAEAMAAMLKTNNSLHTLHMSGNSIGASGAEAIAAMLKTNNNLHTLKMCGNSIGAAGAEAIAAMLGTNISLHTLHMSGNSIGDAGAEAIASMLKTNTSLHKLYVSTNSIGDVGAVAMAAGLNDTLTTLYIKEGNNIGSAGRKALADVRRHRPTLTIDIL